MRAYLPGVLLLLLVAGCDRLPEVAYPLAPNEPEQERVAPIALEVRHGVGIEKVANFAITALILGTRNYEDDPMGAVVPVDFAMAWGNASNPEVQKKLTVSQFRRLSSWRYEGAPPLPHAELVSSMSNVHMVPANPELAHQLDAVNRGDVVHLTGYLVNLSLPDGQVLRTSLSRRDQGRGACEILYVVSVTVWPVG